MINSKGSTIRTKLTQMLKTPSISDILKNRFIHYYRICGRCCHNYDVRLGILKKICVHFITATLRASEDETPIRDYVSVAMQLNKERISHNFVVVDKLIVPVILGVNFLQGNGLTLDFSSTLFR